jgi:hypothetical protein
MVKAHIGGSEIISAERAIRSFNRKAGPMRQGSNPKRMRGRGNGRKNTNPRIQNFESNGPEVKVRGNAQQVVEKYLALARDASLAGDRITAEGYFQHAEHYYRLMSANGSDDRENRVHSEPNNLGGQPQPADDAASSAEAVDSQGNGADAPPANGDATGDDPGSQPQPDIGENGENEAARPE